MIMLTKAVFIFFYAIILFFPIQVHAQANFKLEQPKGFGVETPKVPNLAQPYAEKVVEGILLNVITIFYAVGGMGVIVYFVWGAVDWILSGGDKEKVANARKKMTHAIIGLVLLSLSFVIINIVGQIVGFNPLGNLQLRGLGNTNLIMQN
jgi:hypothetical protein